ncbi:MAG: PepSY domain-containing protein [Paracoccus sp. (in: a-proteobacteria)]
MIRIVLILLALSSPLFAGPVEKTGLLPFYEIVKIVGQRFEGRALAARLDTPTPMEYALGANLVQELMLMTAQNNILKLRLNAETGQVLEVRGRGLTEARRPAKENRNKKGPR